MAMLLVAPVFRPNLPTSPPNSSSLLVNPITSSSYSQFPSSLRPVIFGEEMPHQPGIIQCVRVDDVESGTGVDSVKASEAGTSDADDESAITTSLQLYKEALQNNDETKLAEIEALFKSIEDAKDDLEKKVVSLSQELTVEKIRVVRISAEFDNFRKSIETERLSLVISAQGEIVEKLLPVLDNFKRAKTEMKVATEGEEKINNSYQSIYKQFADILASADVVPVETVVNWQSIIQLHPPHCLKVQNRDGLNPIDRLLGKMLQLLNHSFFRVYIVGTGPGWVSCHQTFDHWLLCSSETNLRNCCRDLLAFTSFLRSSAAPRRITIVFCNSISAICFTCNPVQHQRTKHIDSLVRSVLCKFLHATSSLTYATYIPFPIL